MTDLATAGLVALPVRAAPGMRPRVAPVATLALVGAVAGIALGRADAADPTTFEGALVVLLRFMTVCKAATALAAAALLLWRGRRPLSDRAFAAYGGALALMAAAPGMIWSLGLIAPGALFFHVGLLVFAITALRDDGVTVLPRRRA